MKSLFAFIVLLPTGVLAQEAVENVASKIPDGFGPVVLAVVAFVMSEIVAKRWPTANPYSWFFLGKRFANAFELIFKKLGTICEQLGNAGQVIKK